MTIAADLAVAEKELENLYLGKGIEALQRAIETGRYKVENGQLRYEASNGVTLYRSLTKPTEARQVVAVEAKAKPDGKWYDAQKAYERRLIK